MEPLAEPEMAVPGFTAHRAFIGPAPRDRRLRGDDGSVAPLVILTPIIVFLVTWVVQIGLYFHARSIVEAAAQDGARAAQIENGTSADAAAAAGQILSGSRNLITETSIDVDAKVDTVTVTVSGNVQNVLPFWGGGSIKATASGPVERFRSESER